MPFDLEYFKKHKAVTGAIVVGALVIVYMIHKSGSSSSSGGVAGVLAQQQQGQLQMAQLNAQLSAQGDQTQAQLQAEQIAAGTQQTQAQDQIAGQIVAAQLGYNSQNTQAEEYFNAVQQRQAQLLPLESTLSNMLSSGNLAGHEAEQQSILNALELFLSGGSASGLPPVYSPQGSNTGFSLNIPGLGSLGLSGL